VKSTDIITERLSNIPEGMIFDYTDIDVPQDLLLAAAKAVSRMVASGTLRKAGKGKFYKPKFSRLGEVPPSIEGLTRDLLFKDKVRIGYITGVPAFAQLGLTTQVSSKIIIGSKFYRRPLKRGGYDISFTKQENEITGWNIPLLRILDAIKLIKKIPATTPTNVAERLKVIIAELSEAEIDELISLSMLYPSSTRAILGAILESINKTASGLNQTLNPFTKYNTGISKVILPTKGNWNIS